MQEKVELVSDFWEQNSDVPLFTHPNLEPIRKKWSNLVHIFLFSGKIKTSDRHLTCCVVLKISVTLNLDDTWNRLSDAREGKDNGFLGLSASHSRTKGSGWRRRGCLDRQETLDSKEIGEADNREGGPCQTHALHNQHLGSDERSYYKKSATAKFG